MKISQIPIEILDRFTGAGVRLLEEQEIYIDFPAYQRLLDTYVENCKKSYMKTVFERGI